MLSENRLLVKVMKPDSAGWIFCICSKSSLVSAGREIHSVYHEDDATRPDPTNSRGSSGCLEGSILGSQGENSHFVILQNKNTRRHLQALGSAWKQKGQKLDDRQKT